MNLSPVGSEVCLPDAREAGRSGAGQEALKRCNGEGNTLCCGGRSQIMTIRIATAEWANPAEVEERYRYSDGTVWLGRSASQNQVPIGYLDDRHICLVSGSR